MGGWLDQTSGVALLSAIQYRIPGQFHRVNNRPNFGLLWLIIAKRTEPYSINGLAESKGGLSAKSDASGLRPKFDRR